MKLSLIAMMAFLWLMPLAPVQAAQDPAVIGIGAENFIKKLGGKAIEAIETTGEDDKARRAAFRKILTQNFDMDMIARFAMGRYWGIATPAEQKTYTRLFKRMVVDVYAGRFSDYSGQVFEVTGNKPSGRKDIIVNSRIVPQGNGSKILVDWRVRPVKKGYKIIDVIVEGVSMSVTQRSEFASIIQRGGGEIASLIAHLEQ